MDFLIDPYAYPPPPVIGFHAPLSANDQDIISPIANALTNDTPLYIGGWCRLSGDTQQIRWRPVTEAAQNAKLAADSYTQKLVYRCRVRKGVGTTGTPTLRFFYIYSDFGYLGFSIASSSMVKYIDYRLFPPSPLLNEYSDFIISGEDSVYEIRYPANSGFAQFYVDDVLVYTSLFPTRLVGNGISIRTPDFRMSYMEFKDCQMIIG